MNLKRITVFGLVLLIGLAGIGLGAQSKYTIAFSQSTMISPWAVSLTNDMKFWAQKLGVNLIWTDGSNDAAKQLSDVEDLISKKPDVIVMTPFQAEALTPVADMCTKANIPLICIDRYIKATPGTGMYLTYISQDQKLEGTYAARAVLEKLKAKFGSYKGNIVELQGTVGAGPTIDRGAGFLEEVSKYPDVKIIASQSGDFMRENGMKIMEDWLQTFPKGKIDAVYCHNDEMGLGAMAAINAANRTEILGYIAGIDGEVGALEAVLKGQWCVDVQNSPYFGEAAIKNALSYLKGEKLPIYQQIPLKVFTTTTAKAKKETQDYYNYMMAHKLYF